MTIRIAANREPRFKTSKLANEDIAKTRVNTFIFQLQTVALLSDTPQLDTLQRVDFRSNLGQFLVSFGSKLQRASENRLKIKPLQDLDSVSTLRRGESLGLKLKECPDSLSSKCGLVRSHGCRKQSIEKIAHFSTEFLCSFPHHVGLLWLGVRRSTPRFTAWSDNKDSNELSREAVHR